MPSSASGSALLLQGDAVTLAIPEFRHPDSLHHPGDGIEAYSARCESPGHGPFDVSHLEIDPGAIQARHITLPLCQGAGAARHPVKEREQRHLVAIYVHPLESYLEDPLTEADALSRSCTGISKWMAIFICHSSVRDKHPNTLDLFHVPAGPSS